MAKQGNDLGRASSPFNPFANPFALLGIPATATAQDIEAAFWKQVGGGFVSTADLEAARQALIDPSSRLDAELLNIFDPDGASAHGAPGLSHKGGPPSALAGIAASLPPLPRSNVLAYIYAATPVDAAGLKAFVEAQGAVRADAVCDAINKWRRTAGFDAAGLPDVTQAIRRLQQRQSEAVVGAMTDLSAGGRLIASIDTRPSRSASDIAPYLDLMGQVYARLALPELLERRDELFEAVARLKEAPRDAKRIHTVTKSLTEWAELWRLLQRADAGLSGHAARVDEVKDELHKFRVWSQISGAPETGQRIEETADAVLGPLADAAGRPSDGSGLSDAAVTPDPIQAVRKGANHRADTAIGNDRMSDGDFDHRRMTQIRPQAMRAMTPDGERRARSAAWSAAALYRSLPRPGARIVGWGAAALTVVALAWVMHGRITRPTSLPRPDHASAMDAGTTAAVPSAPAAPAPGPGTGSADSGSGNGSGSLPSSPPAAADGVVPSVRADAAPQAAPGAAAAGTAAPGQDSAPPAPAGPATETAGSALDLLQMPDASKVQRRLADLGYFAGTPNGVWGPQSRGALRQFKSANALPGDDEWDRPTQERLFSGDARGPSAGAGANTAAAAAATDEPQRTPETRYEPPAGATLNPLNKDDAVRVQKRLIELGYFGGPAAGVWGKASRSALLDMKVVNGLPADDSWTPETERIFAAPETVKADDSFVGGWAGDPGECRPAASGGAPVRITGRDARTEGGSCVFSRVRRTSNGWRASAACTGNGEKWKSDVTLSVAGDDLTWVSERGTMSFHRCRGG